VIWEANTMLAIKMVSSINPTNISSMVMPWQPWR
jgi:hypothetical protein